MAHDVSAKRPAAVRTGDPASATPFAGIAFSTWTAAFAVGALVHLWQGVHQPWSVGPLAAVAAFAVLMRPSSPARLAVLHALLVAEAVVWLPDLLNHQILVAILGLTLLPWWLFQAVRSPSRAHDAAFLHERVAPYLRVAFIAMWLLAAVAKFNAGFVDAVTTCSVWILDSIPGVTVSSSLAPLAIGGTLAIELAVPLLLLFHRTRPLAIVAGFGFHLVSAFAGHASFSGFAWSFYLLFLPPAAIARGVVAARVMLPRPVRACLAAALARPWWSVAAFGVAWWLGRTLLPASLAGPARNWGAALLCAGWMALCGWLLVRLWRHWVFAPGPRASLRVTDAVMLVGLGLLVLTAATPYLGLKSRASLTMFSNVRTEPGHWNHLLVPEQVRLFDWQDGDVHFLSSDDPALDAKIAGHEGEHTVLLDLRRLVDEFPDAAVRYELDGVERIAAPLSADPVLGAPLSPAQELFAAMRPYNETGSCQH
jgi:hypothetical protein